MIALEFFLPLAEAKSPLGEKVDATGGRKGGYLQSPTLVTLFQYRYNLNMAHIPVNLAQIRFSSDPNDIIIAHGLGSCVGVSIYDRSTKLGGMAHVVLPSSIGFRSGQQLLERFADTAVPQLLKDFMRKGGNFSQSTIKIAGGADMANIVNLFDIGQKNIKAVKNALQQFRLSPCCEDVGGSWARTVHLYIDSGKVTSRRSGKDEISL